MNKCVFLDRDGVLNVERGKYTYKVEDFKIIDGVVEALKTLKKKGYLIIVITNQAGISRGLYSREQMNACHHILQNECENLIDDIYYSPYHPTVTESISRKPDSLMFEKAIAKYDINCEVSWMVGDKERDLIPAKKLGIATILVGNEASHFADHNALNLINATNIIE